ncbi:MAG: hypothetical protein IJQ01_09540 [Selenomonadaceae bacterium]|nr:hypothetical protein [Selenomonadaceae bacterium]
MFYDNHNFEGLKFFSEIKTHPTVAKPCEKFLDIIKQLKTPPTQRNIVVAEISLGYGATALQVLKLLDAGDMYCGFDFEDKVKDLTDDLQARDFGIKCQIVLSGNSRNQWDSYNWNLSELIFRMREQNLAGIFDAVYLDGAHTLLHDGLAVCLLKELIKDGGYLILDDLFWSYSTSKIEKGLGWDKFMSKEQADDKQIFRVQELFLTNDSNWERLSSPKEWRGIFRKRLH